jgi:hypothetical protein
MKEEYNSLMEKNTWELAPIPSNMKLARCKCILNKNRDDNGYIKNYNSWLLAKYL